MSKIRQYKEKIDNKVTRVEGEIYRETIRFSGHGNSINNIIPLLKKENVHLFSCPYGYNNYMDAYFQSPWEDSGSDRVVCKKYGCNLQDTFKLIGRAIAMTS